MRLFLLLVLFPLATLSGQRQYADTTYRPPRFTPKYVIGTGPLILVDTAHHNAHTRTGRYRPFAQIAELDGFRTGAFTKPFTEASLKGFDILVIVNAIPESSLEKWESPTASAFTREEVAAVNAWVKSGGRLFLIADHMPMGGAAKDLAASFGFTFYDSFADNRKTLGGREIFQQKDGSLVASPLTEGGEGYFTVDRVATFSGQAFELPPGATDVLHCGEGWISFLPKVAWRFTKETPRLNSAGWSQGAYMNYGQGKIAVFGEA
ncbi:MAG: DUF4350 domain-containing protein, partial [Bacteroidota bacterium]